jgi:hypothetical protein
MTRGICADPIKEMERRKKQSETMKGHGISEETRRKLSEGMKGENNPMFGKHLSDGHRKKISESVKKTRKLEKKKSST